MVRFRSRLVYICEIELIKIILPDGTEKKFEKGVNVTTIANSIGARLSKAAVAGNVNGQTVDMSFEINEDAAVSILTLQSSEGLDIIRHSCAHLMAQAVKRLFPSAEMAIGPVIEDGFYYDFKLNHTFTEDDLTNITKEMNNICSENLTLSRKEVSKKEALQLFKGLNETYKLKIINDLPDNETITCYSQGEFIDLCRGPHVPSTSYLKAFKLTKLSGAYWKGDSDNEMLQRIYGTAWGSKADLEKYLEFLKEAERRDHRKIGKKLGLFHFQSDAPGMVFWHENGWIVYRLVQDYIRLLLQKNGYSEIKTPEIIDRSLWEKSGHWDVFQNEMFITETENHKFAIKPMNCPAHVQIYNQGIKSYRDLPVRLAEFGCCHRREPSGTLHGLLRVRQFVQDDAHIFCTEDQVQEEVSKFIDLVLEVYNFFQLGDVQLKLSTRPEKRVGDDYLWDKAEASLEKSLVQSGKAWELLPGEGAFYGPKIEFSLKDSLNRVWQCGTIQVDFSMPERLGANYIDANGDKKPVVMLHRAIIGTFERFIGILIEHYAGNMPFWLCPVQCVVIGVSDRNHSYVDKLTKTILGHQIRVSSDLRNEKIGFKIREHSMQRIPFQIIVGDKEEDSCMISVRCRDEDDWGIMGLAEFCDRINIMNQINRRI